jgi:tetratricopeptide (TPR) repeat protein
MRNRSLLVFVVLFVRVAPAIVTDPLQDGLALEKQGKLKEALELYRSAAQEFRTAGNQHNLAAALSAAGYVSVSLGDYAGAITEAEEAVKLRQALHENAKLGTDLNTIGLAYQYQGNYAAALEYYQQALTSDRMQSNAAGQVTRLNNIGNIYYYYQSRYMQALASYQDALNIVNANAGQAWSSWGRKLTTGNIATLYQRLGLEQRALELYQQNAGKPESMEPSEYAQLLLNEGILYRHLGDPVKALEIYETSQSIFRKSQHSDGEIAAFRSIGIVKTMDLGDLPGALTSFNSALELAQASSNNRGSVQANLYLGEVLRRLGRYSDGTSHLETALEGAQRAGLVEEQWKSLYALGRIAEQAGDSRTALDYYTKAISIIESVRAGLRVPLRSDFLADKRDVYDSLISLQLQQPTPSADELFQWMERSRARTLLDRMAARTPLTEASLKLVQSHLPADTVLIEFWVGGQSGLAVWITQNGTGMVRYASADALRLETGNLLRALQSSGNEWRDISRAMGTILTGIPLRRHLILVPDGPLNIPFEVLEDSETKRLLIERCDISYLPSARFLTMPKESGRRWLFPWTTELMAIGDPLVSSNNAFTETEVWQALPAAADEMRGIASIIPGKAYIHQGADARKSYLLDRRIENLPLLHLSTHALVDSEVPERSRILLASDSLNSADYLFQEEVSSLDLKNVGLVTLSACDTARGKIVRGEGIQAFSQSFLAAGASATITSMWRVADAPTAGFMEQLYYSLVHGMSKAEALQAAKLRFLNSNSEISSPRYWAAFILYGDGWEPTVSVVTWSAILVVLSVVLAAIAVALRWFLSLRVAKTKRRTAALSQ